MINIVLSNPYIIELFEDVSTQKGDMHQGRKGRYILKSTEIEVNNCFAICLYSCE